jgi:outer membrane protein
MLSKPPFGVEWKKVEKEVRREHEQMGLAGRFGPGLPRISDGSLLFLLHLLSKMRPAKDGGSRIGIVLNGSPLFTGGATQNRIKETLALEDQSRNQLDGARRGVALGTRQAFFGLQSGLAQVKALEAAEASSKLALESTQLGYRVGVRVNLDVLNAQSQLVTTQRDLAKARYDVLLATLRLRQASGQLGTADVESVNRLLAR